MLSFHVKFVQTDVRTDRQMDNGKTICPPIFRYRGIKIADDLTDIYVAKIMIFFFTNIG